jgi:hypothetical protein
MFIANENIDALDERVKDYLKKPLIQSFSLYKIGKSTEYKYKRHGCVSTCYGLLAKIRQVYHPDFSPYDTASQRSTYTRSLLRRGSTRKEGERIDREIGEWTRRGGGAPDKKWHALTQKLVNTLLIQGHVPQASQVPVFFPQWDAPLGRATCADLITKNPATGTLCMWEIKTGMPVEQRAKNSFFKHVTHAETGKPIPCTTKDMWQFQLHFTQKGLEQGGLPVDESRIIMVCKAKNNKNDKTWGSVVETYKRAPWIKQVGFN